MKKLHLIILMAFVGITASAQSIGEAFYIYRNDGLFNAFFVEDVDSMTYSYYEENGVRYDEIVTQRVYTKDSLYSIPLASIDSVAFRVNDIVVSQDYLPVSEDGYTIVSADVEKGDYVLNFNGNIPNIEVGSVMTIFGDTISEMIRVVSVQRCGQQVTLTSEKASLGDVFTSGSFTLSTEQIAGSRSEGLMPNGTHVYYPVEVTYYDEQNRRQSIRRDSPRRVDFEHNLYSYTIDYSGQEFYKNNYMRFYLQTCRLDFNLDLVVSCNFNTVGEGLDKWHKGELALQKSVIRGKVDTDFMLRFDASGEKKEELPELMLKRNMHKPISVKFLVAGVPVVVVMNTHLLAHGSYDVKGNFSAYAGFATSTTAELGCSWSQASGLKPYGLFNSSFTMHDPTIEGSAHLEEKIGVFPRVTFSIYGLLGPTFDIKPYVRQRLDLGFYDDLIASTKQDFYAAEYNLYAGYDAAVGLSFLSVAGNEPFVKSPSWNVAESHLYEAPKNIKFEKASSEMATPGKPIEVSFRVTDMFHLFGREVSPAFPMTVKFETNSGELSNDFASIDTSTGLATITWIPSSESSDNKYPYIVAMMHDNTGRVITADRWTPKKGSCPDGNHPHMIDMGLPSGTKWACCNVGAYSPEQYGGYFEFGETSERASYNPNDGNLFWDSQMIDREYPEISNIAGSSYDVATVLWGSPWRIPSIAQIKELLNYTTPTGTTQNGVDGCLFTGTNGNTIFFPFAGTRWLEDFDIEYGGFYWSSNVCVENAYYAYGFNVYFNGAWSLDLIWYGRTVRPVCSK